MEDIVHIEKVVFIQNLYFFLLRIPFKHHYYIFRALSAKGNIVCLLYFDLFVVSPELEFLDLLSILIEESQLMASGSNFVFEDDGALSDDGSAGDSLPFDFNDKHA